MEHLEFIASWAADIFTVVGVIWPYYAQAYEMMQAEKQQSAKRNDDEKKNVRSETTQGRKGDNEEGGGFDTRASMILLVSSTIRVFFWIAKRFQVVLLLQAIATIVTQTLMLRFVSNYTARQRQLITSTRGGLGTEGTGQKQKGTEEATTPTSSLSTFIRYSFLGLLVLLSTFYLYSTESWFVESLGYMSLGIEAMLPLPQLLQHQFKKSTKGFSLALFTSWLFGDLFKTIVAVVKQQPFVFQLCGAFQSFADILILCQMIAFREKGEKRKGG